MEQQYTYIDSVFVEEFMKAYVSHEDMQPDFGVSFFDTPKTNTKNDIVSADDDSDSDYEPTPQEILNKNKQYFWKIYDKNEYRKNKNIGYVNDLEYLSMKYSPGMDVEEFDHYYHDSKKMMKDNALRDLYDENDNTYYDTKMLTNRNFTFARVYDRLCNNFEEVPDRKHFFFGAFSEICKAWRDIYKDVMIHMVDKVPLNKLIDDGYFTFEEDTTKIHEMIDNMIYNCLDDPRTEFSRYGPGPNGEEGGKELVISVYRRNEFNKNRKNKYVMFGSKEYIDDLPDKEELKNIFREELYGEKYGKVERQHYVCMAQATNPYDCHDYVSLKKRIQDMILELEVDARFKDTLYDLTKLHIKCMGCREDQPNQLAHIGENGCLGEF